MEVRNETWRITPSIITLAFLFWAGSLYLTSVLVAGPVSIKVECGSTHTFTNPSLDCFSKDVLESAQGVKSSVESYVKSAEETKDVDRVAVFFRDLTTHRWFGIKENDVFAPGSLLKVPLAVTYYKYAEVQPDILSTEFVFNPKDAVSRNDRQHVKPPEVLARGKSYTVSELIKRMIAYSDNDAVSPLFDSVNHDFYNRVLLDLGIRMPTTGGVEQNFVSVKTYGSIFRTLYNASYLNRDQSDMVLTAMSRSSFKDGITAGVPSDVLVSHKFGERQVVDEDTKVSLSTELHDCGIVYKGEHPYVLCVMTEGSDFDVQEKVIADISRIVYEGM